MIYTSQIPTSREQVNIVGAGISSIAVGDRGKARDDASLQAMHQLSDAGIVEYRPVIMAA
jgi:hypothetical protein